MTADPVPVHCRPGPQQTRSRSTGEEETRRLTDFLRIQFHLHVSPLVRPFSGRTDADRGPGPADGLNYAARFPALSAVTCAHRYFSAGRTPTNRCVFVPVDPRRPPYTWTPVDHCLSSPCKNGATCTRQVDTYVCKCSPGYHGSNCDKARLASNGCRYRNGGCEHFCRDHPDRSHMCFCAPGYSLGRDNSSCLPQENVVCGRPLIQFAPRVVNGQTCPKGHCPWQALLTKDHQYSCGAIVLSDQWVMTAAHCVWGKATTVYHVIVGDSGGPLVTRYKKTWFLTGVVSWGKGCANENLYGVYTRVSNFLGWIEDVMSTGRNGTSCQAASVPDSCELNPCLNGGSCSTLASSYTCYCLPQFSGLNCELEHLDAPNTCLLDNGGCDHFCEEEDGAQTPNCSCADGYFLHDDGMSCVAKEPVVCGSVPVLREQNKSQQLDPRGRIVGGTECPKGECPWQVLLVYKDKGFCGGVIYKPTWILTASHCLESYDAQFLKVVAGEHNTEVNEGTEQHIRVAEIIMHENYKTITADNDIALLRLASPIVYTAYAVPVCLPTRPLAERDLWAVSLHTVSGWGRRGENGPTSHILRRLKVPRIRTQQCVEDSGVVLTDNMFCAGYIEGRQDSCKGDSGGPLVTEYKKTAFLLGIVSWGKGCARPGNYGIYTRVSNYLEWIHNRTATPSQPTNNTEASVHNLTT
ncbi:Coagulation factor VII [Larimichthys crocea]|nr:Coagulation factor VII [Larimichthys crocea]